MVDVIKRYYYCDLYSKKISKYYQECVIKESMNEEFDELELTDEETVGYYLYTYDEYALLMYQFSLMTTNVKSMSNEKILKILESCIGGGNEYDIEKNCITI
jgi:hypothetical protein